MHRPPRTHVFIIDGTFSRLIAGEETNAGLTFRLLDEVGQTVSQSVGYHPGVQGRGWRKWLDAAAGIGINEAIAAGYATLASRYRPGDRIVLMGYSRGAYAVRSLAGWIGRVGLLTARHATARRVVRAFRYYEAARLSPQGARFAERFCHRDVQIEMVGVWDTVSALGLPYPLLNRLAPMVTDFHDDRVGGGVRHAYQALAIDETRGAYEPILWHPSSQWRGVMEQVWFPGNHGDVGGHVHARPAARPLANLSLVWMLERLMACGVELPDGWRARFPTDPLAPSVGNWTAAAKLFWFRYRRLVQPGPHEAVHPSVEYRARTRTGYRPLAEIAAMPERTRAAGVGAPND
ncbi:DUF2235 domain-containing protein [Roseobacter sp. HKCCA0434]|uniref:DUF2235 domain-containing protein n=1 Tax=Roseobacter sp. HKCCA0434 TaxID=3079297 RepID=UPI002905945E|nr:DUF2235 domain-containing protein [Roseobacter sp. HKCCA0434]